MSTDRERPQVGPEFQSVHRVIDPTDPNAVWKVDGDRRFARLDPNAVEELSAIFDRNEPPEDTKFGILREVKKIGWLTIKLTRLRIDYNNEVSGRVAASHRPPSKFGMVALALFMDREQLEATVGDLDENFSADVEKGVRYARAIYFLQVLRTVCDRLGPAISKALDLGSLLKRFTTGS